MSVFLKRGVPGGFCHPPRIVCFICGAEVPSDYPLYAQPQHMGMTPSPYFPFLLYHPPPLGCSPVDQTGGEAKACRLCYTALMRQWKEYERARVPALKRVYWIKRADGVPFLSSEEQQRAAIQIQARMGGVTVVATTADGVMIAPNPPPAAIIAPPPEPSSKSNSSVPAAHGSWSSKESVARRPPSRTILNPSQAQGPVSAHVEDPAATAVILSSASASNDNDSALDLSSGSRERETMKSRSSVASHVSVVSHHSSYQSEGAGSSTDILDLTLPDKNAAFEVCYVCGDEFKKGMLSFSFAKQMDKEPFYPSLLRHPRPAKSRPIDSSGRVQTCDDCHNHLLQQWFQFESEETPHSDRNYSLRKRPALQIDNTTFVCYICALEYQSSSLRLLYARPNNEHEPYYPFIEQQKPPPGASPISPQGMVQVCTLCYKSTKEKHHGFRKGDQPPPKKRRIEAAEFSVVHHSSQDDDNLMPADVTCILCRRKFSVGTFKWLHSQGPPRGGLPYFPFLAQIARPEEYLESEEDKQNRVRACQACTTSLLNQWTAFQREGVPIESRKYNYPCLVTGPRSVSSVRALSPASQISGGTVTPGNKGTADSSSQNLPRPKSNTTITESQQATPNSPSAPTIPSPATGSNIRSAILSPPCHSPAFSGNSVASATAGEQQQPTSSTGISLLAVAAATVTTASGTVPLQTNTSQSFLQSTSATTSVNATVTTSATTTSSTAKTPASSSTSSFYCFLCGLHSELSFSRMLYSTPQGKKAPYFPFMKKHVPKNKAETLREDGTALVCTFCYHSVMSQWTKYNETRPLVDPSQRKYNFHDYICYVCGIQTYRKRIRALRVLDYPFLRNHKPRLGVIMLENGEMVAVCLDCYERLRGQFIDGERYGIPVEQRQYNWIKVPPPPEISSSQLITPQERLGRLVTSTESSTITTAPPTTSVSTAPAVVTSLTS